MQLKGSFESNSLASILQMLHNDSKTGELKLTSMDREVVLFLREGNVVFVRGSGMENRVGTLLRSKGIISAQQLQEALAAAREKKQVLGKTLVELGFITEDMLRKVIHKQAEDLIFGVFLWESGQFDYNDVGPTPSGLLETRLDIMSVILEATRRIDEMRVLHKSIESDEIIFKISDRFGEKERLKFNAIEWRFLSLIDGTRSVRQLIFESGYEDFAVFKVLNSLLSFKLIERVEAGQATETSGEGAYGPLLTIYLDILAEIMKTAETELASQLYRVVKRGRPVRNVDEDERRDAHREQLRQWLSYLVCASKPVITPDSADILRSFVPDQPPDVFLHAATEAMQGASDPDKVSRFLADAMNRLLENFFLALRKVIGRAQTRQVLRETSRILRFVVRYQKELAEKTGIVKEVEQVLRRAEQSLRTGRRRVREGGRIFTVDLRYEPMPITRIPRAEGPALKAPAGVGAKPKRKAAPPVLEAQVVETKGAAARAREPEWTKPAQAAPQRPASPKPAPAAMQKPGPATEARPGRAAEEESVFVVSPEEMPVEELQDLEDLEELEDAIAEIEDISSLGGEVASLEELDPVEAAARELEAAFDPEAMGGVEDLGFPDMDEPEQSVVDESELSVVGDLESVDDHDLEPMGDGPPPVFEEKSPAPEPRRSFSPRETRQALTGIDAPGLEEALEREGRNKAAPQPASGGSPAELEEWDIPQDEILEMED